MPLKVTCGLSRKLGMPDYGSLGASCHVEFELDATLLQTDLDSFQRSVRNAYVACSQAVSDELARHREVGPEQHRDDAQAETVGQPRSNRNGNGHRASQKQLDYASQLARQIPDVGVRRIETLAQRLHGRPVADLSSLEVSSLIDALIAIKEGRIDADTAFNGSAA